MTTQSSTFDERMSEMELNPSSNIILKLKAVKEEKHLSIKDIMEEIKENGDYLSSSTLRRVFADDSEYVSFSYEHTLRPIVSALLPDEEEIQDNPSALFAETELLKTIIQHKDDEIEQLRELKEHLEERIEFLISQISLKDSRMDQKDVIIQKLMDKCL